MTFSVILSKWTVYKYINDGVFLRVTNESLPMGGSKKRFLTMTERTSRADLMFLMPDGTMAASFRTGRV